jgi:PAS domain S-box-containing protein
MGLTQGAPSDETAPLSAPSPAEAPHQESSARRDMARAAILILTYIAAGEVGLRFASFPPHVTLVWPAAGIALAAVVLWGWRMVPAIGVAALLLNFGHGLELRFALWTGIGNAFEAAIAAALFKLARIDPSLRRRRDVVSFAFLPTLVAPVVAATIGAGSLVLADPSMASRFGALWSTWWAGDAAGLLSFGSLLLVWSRMSVRRPSLWTALEAGALAAFGLVSVGVIFFVPDALSQVQSFTFLVIPALLWAATRWGAPAVTALLALFDASAVWALAREPGSIAASHDPAFLHLWLFVGVVSFSALLLAAIVAEQQDTERALARSEGRFRRLADDVRQVAFFVDLETLEVLYVSPYLAEIAGRPIEELRSGRVSWQQLIHPEDRDRLHETWLHWRDSGGPAGPDLVFRMLRADGEMRWVRQRLGDIFEEDDSGRRVSGVLEDITQERRAAEEAHQRETRLRMLTEQIPTAVVWTTDCELKLTWAGGGWLRQLGPLETLPAGLDIGSYHTEDDASRVRALDAHRRALAGEQVIFEYVWKNIQFEGRLEPLRNTAGEIVGVIAVALDLSESRRSADALRQAAENLRRAQAIAHVGSWENSFVGDRPRYWSEELARILQLSPDELRREGAWFEENFVHPDDRVDFRQSYTSRLIEPYPIDFRFRLVRKDGETRYLHALTEPILGEEGQVERVVGTLIDETDRRRSEETRARLSAIVESSWDAIVGMTSDGVVETWNRGAERILGARAEHARGARIGDLLDRELAIELADLVRRTAAGERIASHRLDVRRDGRRVTLTVSLAPIRDPSGAMTGVSLIARDQSDRARLEEQLQQAQKLEAIGTLAGGIAHDFNNLLWVILGNTERVLHKLPASSPLRPMLENVLAASRRARGVIDQILAFSRRDETKLEPVSPSEVIREAVELIRSTLPTSIRMRTSFGRISGVVLGDRNQLHQVVMNLCTNAYHAMGEAGVLTVTLEEVRVGTRSELSTSGLPLGDYAALEVTDTGCGIDQQSAERIFEPFYTTKQGAGTGLGLSTVHGIVTGLGGQVRVSSRPGEGSTFRIYLPLHPPVQIVPALEEHAEPRRIHKGSVLIVDDQPSVLETLAGMLEDLGYEVTSCREGAEALEVVRSSTTSYLAMITDQTMPGMTGLDLARNVHGVRSDLPVLLLSGYSKMLSEESLAAHHVSGFLAKPLEFDDLERALERVTTRT